MYKGIARLLEQECAFWKRRRISDRLVSSFFLTSLDTKSLDSNEGLGFFENVISKMVVYHSMKKEESQINKRIFKTEVDDSMNRTGDMMTDRRKYQQTDRYDTDRYQASSSGNYSFLPPIGKPKDYVNEEVL